jgi:hypothetical protein
VSFLFAYFDASGHPKEPARRVLTVAGFVATEERWKKFEPKWEAVLASEGASSFHMKHFAHFKKDFKDGWRNNEPRRRAFIGALASVVRRHVKQAFSHSVFLDHYDAVNKEYRMDEVFKPYGLCASQAVQSVTQWARRTHPKHTVLFAFEKGDADQGDLNQMIAFRRIRMAHPPQFFNKHWKTPDGKDQYLRPFEACDLWAYEDALALPIIGTGKQVRGSMRHLSEQIKSHRGGYHEASLRSICKALGVPKR